MRKLKHVQRRISETTVVIQTGTAGPCRHMFWRRLFLENSTHLLVAGVDDHGVGLEREVLRGSHGDDRRRNGRAVDTEPVAWRMHVRRSAVKAGAGSAESQDFTDREKQAAREDAMRPGGLHRAPSGTWASSGLAKTKGHVLLALNAGVSKRGSEVRTVHIRRQRSR